MRAAFGEEFGPAVHFLGDEIVHRCAAADQAGETGGQVAEGADVLFELRCHGAFDRPVPAVVHAWGDLIDHWTACCREELNGKHADMIERVGDGDRGFSGARHLKGHLLTAGHRRAAQDAVAVRVLGRFPHRVPAICPARENDREFRVEGDTGFSNRRLLAELDYVGVCCVELFDVDGELLANEIAPRVHNSGHGTIEGAETSQFENHVRAVLGWPLGPTAARGVSAMVNCIGALPDRDAMLAVPGAHLHDYGKHARRGRKVGHVTVCADDAAALEPALARVLELVRATADG